MKKSSRYSVLYAFSVLPDSIQNTKKYRVSKKVTRWDVRMWMVLTKCRLVWEFAIRLRVLIQRTIQRNKKLNRPLKLLDKLEFDIRLNINPLEHQKVSCSLQVLLLLPTQALSNYTIILGVLLSLY